MEDRRISKHPIFGDAETKKEITLYLGEEKIPAYEGDTIATALWAAGKRVSRYSPKRCEARGLFCAIGQCSDCLMVVDGVPNTRTCITEVKNGMKVEVQQGLGDWRDIYA